MPTARLPTFRRCCANSMTCPGLKGRLSRGSPFGVPWPIRAMSTQLRSQRSRMSLPLWRRHLQRLIFPIFHFPAWVEVCRAKQETPIPADLADGYFAALQRFPALVAEAASARNDPDFSACATAAVTATLGQHAMAEVILEISSPGLALEVLGWIHDR